MKQRIFLPVLLFLFLLIGCSSQNSQPTEATVETIPESPALMDATLTVTTPEDFLELSSQNHNCRIIWSVPFSSGFVRSDTAALQLDSLQESDLSLFPYLTDLHTLDLTACRQWELVLQLLSMYPDLNIAYAVPLGGTLYSSDYCGDISLINPDPDQILLNLPYLPNVQTIILEGELPSAQQLKELKDCFPGVTFVWEFDFFGVAVSTLTESVDISGTPLTDTNQLESLLPLFYQLRTVDMCGCGLDNDVMGSLNERYAETDFVWKVKIGSVTTRTDARYFMPSKFGVSWMRQEQTENLKYLTKLELLDLGHYEGISDISFLHYMPNLRILSLNSGVFTDFTPIGACQDLEYCELFLAKGTDLWPLLNCTSLKNLNISYMPYCDILPICQMAWLDRLWICGSKLNASERELLRTSLPDTIIVFDSKSSTGNGWRHSPSYYESRDLVNMGYMIK